MTSISASAPGSFFVIGEHSVLRGHPALILAMNQRLTVTLTQRSDRILHIQSSLGQLQTHLDAIQVSQPFTYILQTFQLFPPSSGFNVTIQSQMSSQKGFGTSAAVVIALLGALKAFINKSVTFSDALSVIQKVQGHGSGADLMASLHGGAGLYQQGHYRPLPLPPPLFGVYSGSKTPTPSVIEHVLQRFSPYPTLLKALDIMNSILVQQAEKYWNSPEHLGTLLNTGSGLMEAMGLHTPELSQWLWQLRKQSWGVKLSGSGLGDCAIGVIQKDPPPESFPISIASQGLHISYD